MEKEKKTNKGLIALIIVIVCSCLLAAFLVLIPPILLAFGIVFEGMNAKEEVITNFSQYTEVVGESAKGYYKRPWGFSEAIFPSKLKDTYDVKSFKSVYYNPWDANYLVYLEIDYDDEDYQREVTRLKDLGIQKYKGYYGVTGFKNYELLAMAADEYNGFIYAITDEKENKIVYVEMIFCNYIMDIDYNKYIPKKYLPDGFDATSGNEYRKSKGFD